MTWSGGFDTEFNRTKYNSMSNFIPIRGDPMATDSNKTPINFCSQLNSLMNTALNSYKLITIFWTGNNAKCTNCIKLCQ